MPPSPISISWGFKVCLVFLILTTEIFLRFIVGSKLRIITPSARNSDIPSLENNEEPIGSSEVITDVDSVDSNTFIM